jgi:deferrochelatase/peroxidase EfeB
MSQPTVSRRRVLGFAAGGAALGVAGVGTAAVLTNQVASASSTAEAAVPFEGAHQAGITTPVQDRLHFTAFDVTTSDVSELRALLKEWTQAARRLTSGQPVGTGGAVDGLPDAPPADTGEVLNLPPAGLTLTIGFGPSLFDDRFGLASKRPAALADLPHFSGEDLDQAISDGDLCIQACSYDEQVALHAVRQLARIGAGVVNTRWAQLGFARTTGVGDSAATPRNLMGFKDGTDNLDVGSVQVTADQLWAQPADGSPWMAGGCYLVSRRIRMVIETWDRTSLREQEAIIGRHKGSGAPLGADGERDTIDFDATDAMGQPVIPADAHVRLAHPSHNGNVHLLRRGYNFADGVDRLGRMDAGLFFLAYQRDPRKQFVPILTQLSRLDRLNEYIKHGSSGLFACPPGVSSTGYWGDTLFG